MAVVCLARRFRAFAAGLWLSVLFLVVQLPSSAYGFYLPGVAPQDFESGDPVKIKVNKLSSPKNLPFDFYSLYPFCKPKGGVVSFHENLGEVLRGDRIENSVFEGKFRKDSHCTAACRSPGLSEADVKLWKQRVRDQYRVNMILDNLPVGQVRVKKVKVKDAETGKKTERVVRFYERGFPVGHVVDDDGGVVVFNHFVFKVLYHADETTQRVVGFEVEPYSVDSSMDGACDPKTGLRADALEGNRLQRITKGEAMTFTYDIVYVKSDITWSTRWESYLTMPTSKDVHWFSIVNSLMVLLFLTGMVAMIMLRTLRRDISAYNDLETAEEAAEETGWKLVHGDVFRPPKFAGWLAVCVGTGTQVLSMVVGSMVLSVMGVLSPANRGSLGTAGIFLFVFSGVFNGYASARAYKSFKMMQWKRTTTRAALAFPVLVSTVFLLLNFLVWGQRSSGAVPFWSLFALMFLWFGVSVPLTFVGSFVGYRKEAPEDPVRTNKIPRQVPETAWWNGWLTTVVMGGVLPFGAVFMELFFILSSLWQQQVYYLFGILTISYTIMAVTCAELAIVLVYFQLCAENYHIWWRSFVAGGSCALYVFGYSIYFFVTRMDITSIVPALLYVGYMFLMSVAMFLMCGSIGFYATDRFVRKIYGSVKID